jgi:UDPglucose--hexose-1-phosphate uridylyltransferase
MSELRQNLLNGNWTVLAPGRGSKPSGFTTTTGCKVISNPSYSQDCPFCPDNDELFPLEVLHKTTDDTGEWSVKTINNKFKLFDEVGYCPPAPEPFSRCGPYAFFNGCGNHFLVVETRAHHLALGELPTTGIRNVLTHYLEAIRSLTTNPNNLVTLIFKNQGPLAGASQPHAHSQIVGSRIVPPQIRSALHVQDRYFDDTGCCALCHIVEYESQVKERVIFESERTITLSPYAASTPYEVWIVPKRHVACLENMHGEELDDLAVAMQQALSSYVKKLDNPDFNYFFHCAPHSMSGAPFYHLYLQILPRLSTPGGFEVGTNIPVNTIWPEDVTAILAG